MVESLNHFCPGCGKAQVEFLRYPWHFCRDCLDLAQDWRGRRLVFGNISMSGGLGWAYADDPDSVCESDIGVLCLINNRPVLVTEARFGGVVAQPFCNAWSRRLEPKVKDLTLVPPPGEAAERQGASQ